MCQTPVNTEMEMSSFWWNFHHRLHWKLSKWQLPVQPMMKILSKWWHFHLSACCMITPSSIPNPWWCVHVSKGTAPQHRKCSVIGATRNGGWQGRQPHRTMLDVHRLLQTGTQHRDSYGWMCWDISSWWCHQMEMFSTLLAFCARNSPVTGEFTA